MTLAAPPLTAGGLEQSLAGLFPPAVSVAITDPEADYPAPFAAEEPAVARAIDRRRREFGAGRAAVREAMRRLGQPPAAVPAGSDRAPVWPPGLTGSISHSARLCVAVVAEVRAFPALGIDIEEALPLDPELATEICTLSERAWLSSLPDDRRGLMARLIFSAKECAYKCQYTRSRTLIGFHDLEITADPEAGQFEATFLGAVPGFAPGARFYGRHAIIDGHIVTGTTANRHQTAWAPERRLSLW